MDKHKLNRALLASAAIGLFSVSLLLLFDFLTKEGASIDEEVSYEIPEESPDEAYEDLDEAYEDPFPPPAPVEKVPAATLTPLYLVLDDAGASVEQLEPFLALDGSFTISVIPGLAESHRVVEAVLSAGKEAFLHLPLEPLGSQNPGGSVIMVNHSDEEIRRKLIEQVESLSGIRGVNNHMGSRATQDERVMRVILEELEKKNLLFLDSRTTANSIVPQVADSLNLPIAVRNVFLDHERSEEFIRASLQKSMDIASRQGYAVMIGHVTVPLLAEILKEEYPRMQRLGFAIFPITDILTRDDSSRN